MHNMNGLLYSHMCQLCVMSHQLGKAIGFIETIFKNIKLVGKGNDSMRLIRKNTNDKYNFGPTCIVAPGITPKKLKEGLLQVKKTPILYTTLWSMTS